MKLSLLFIPLLATLAPNASRADFAPAGPDFSASASADDRDEAALMRVNALLRANPNNAEAYLVRGNIYGDRELWQLAQEDYAAALRLEPDDLLARANLAELKFREKRYDLARADFAALESVGQIRDLADYKVFLCDLLAAHDAVAQRELETFDATGENASYYFGNVAWDIVHHQLGHAREFLASAETIYGPHKVELYAASLFQLGYLPLPAAPAAE